MRYIKVKIIGLSLNMNFNIEFQYLGVKGKNGVDLKEGDTVSFDGNVFDGNAAVGYSRIKPLRPAIGKIYWDEKNCSFEIETLEVGKFKYKNDKDAWNIDFYSPDGKEFAWEDLTVAEKK